MRISYEDALSRYGAIENGVWLYEKHWCVLYTIPEPLVLLNSQGTVQKHIYCNRDMVGALDRAFRNVIAAGLAHELSTFDGCFEIRDVRGEAGKPSTHSYACAIDFNAATNKLNTDGEISAALADCFVSVGFSWGKLFKRKDPMHFSYAWE